MMTTKMQKALEALLVSNTRKEAAEKAGIRPHVKIMIGGAPITQEFCDMIGADVYTSDAASAADAAVMLCNNKEYINKGEAL